MSRVESGRRVEEVACATLAKEKAPTGVVVGGRDESFCALDILKVCLGGSGCSHFHGVEQFRKLCVELF